MTIKKIEDVIKATPKTAESERDEWTPQGVTRAQRILNGSTRLAPPPFGRRA